MANNIVSILCTKIVNCSFHFTVICIETEKMSIETPAFRIKADGIFKLDFQNILYFLHQWAVQGGAGSIFSVRLLQQWKIRCIFGCR